MNDFRERKLEARAKKVASRIVAERKAGIVTSYPPMDAMHAPQAGGWQVPEPSKATLDHMAGFGYVLGPEDAAPAPVAAPAARMEPPEPPLVSPDPPYPSMAEAIAEGVRRVLAGMGFSKAEPIAAGDTPPRNEDK